MPRPKGSKNKSTLLKEYMQGQSEAHIATILKAGKFQMVSEIPSVVNAIVDSAKGGSVPAQRLFCDVVGLTQQKMDPNLGVSITINVGGYDEDDQEGRKRARAANIIDAEREVPAEAQSAPRWNLSSADGGVRAEEGELA